MKKQNEVRYIITDIVAIPILRINKKSDAYRQATGDQWGTVYKDKDGELTCDEDSNAILINSYGKYCLIYPYEELFPKTWFKQEQCDVIITGDSCGYSFWEKEKGLIKICVTYDEKGLIDTHRIIDWTDKPYDDETVIEFDELPAINPFY